MNLMYGLKKVNPIMKIEYKKYISENLIWNVLYRIVKISVNIFSVIAE